MTEISAEAIESVNQLADTWRSFVTDYGSGDVRDLPGMAIRWANSRFSFWNCITLTDQGADRALLDERLAQASAYMRQKTQPGFVWLFEDLLALSCRPDVPAAAAQAGLELSFTGFGMVSDISSIAEPVHPAVRHVYPAGPHKLPIDLHQARITGLDRTELWVVTRLGKLGASAIYQANQKLFTTGLVKDAVNSHLSHYVFLLNMAALSSNFSRGLFIDAQVESLFCGAPSVDLLHPTQI